MEIGPNERYVCLTGKPPKRRKARFLSITPTQLERCLDLTPRPDSTLVVWLLVLNAHRVTRGTEFQFTPKWTQGIRLPSRSIHSALSRLEAAGLIDVRRQRGKSPFVSVRPVEASADE